jgi:DNA topoisomerase-1
LPKPLPPDPAKSAEIQGLRYVSDRLPGLSRRTLRGKAVVVDARGRRVRDAAMLRRVARLAIPPAWTDVWICADAQGHLQATGRDAKGRKQYRYHHDWNAVRNQTKYERLLRFGLALAPLRKRTERDLAQGGLPREKVLATVVRLLETTLIRIGNPAYVKQNRSHGLTTLQDRHVEVKGPRLRFSFKGKSGVPHAIEVEDPRLARIVRQCRDIPGQELFQYYGDDGEARTIGSGDVNGYLREIMGEDFTAKDFRTWAGTVEAASILGQAGQQESAQGARRTVVGMVQEVALRLRNRPATCRKYYVHPAVVEAYLDGSLFRVRRRVPRRPGLSRDEAVVLALLERSGGRAPAPDVAALLSASLRALSGARSGRLPRKGPRRERIVARRKSGTGPPGARSPRRRRPRAAA